MKQQKFGMEKYKMGLIGRLANVVNELDKVYAKNYVNTDPVENGHRIQAAACLLTLA